MRKINPDKSGQVLCNLVPLCHFERLSASLSGELFKSKLYAVTIF
ncbi:MAG: hypothetical protein VB072_04320 [Lentimicrobium sp.]|nr:hypothetical protein [Lentimicrobium sp.]